MNLLSPRAILAMGNAAWQACVEFVPGETGRLRKLGVTEAREQFFEVFVGTTRIPLAATLLPVDQNMRVESKASLIRHDVEAFLRRLPDRRVSVEQGEVGALMLPTLLGPYGRRSGLPRDFPPPCVRAPARKRTCAVGGPCLTGARSTCTPGSPLERESDETSGLF